jgi:ElaB/YqjD/DUF883 family membrane-anchored ribosome-binding protein
MSKPRDTQKTVKKKAEKTLKEKRNEKKEKKDKIRCHLTVRAQTTDPPSGPWLRM